MPKKSFEQKLKEAKGLPKIVELDADKAAKWGGKTMVVPAPMDVYEIMKSVPEGILITIDIIRKILAKKYKTDIACPLTTGIFVNISAFAAVEMDDTEMPWWRTLKRNGELNPKFPGAPHIQKSMLEKEGFQIIEKGKKNKRYVVRDYEKYLLETII